MFIGRDMVVPVLLAVAYGLEAMALVNIQKYGEITPVEARGPSVEAAEAYAYLVEKAKLAGIIEEDQFTPKGEGP